MEARKEGGDGRGKAWPKARRKNDETVLEAAKWLSPATEQCMRNSDQMGPQAMLRSLDFNFQVMGNLESLYASEERSELNVHTC